MPSPPNEETKLLFKLLSDHEWHSYADIKASIAAKIPPGLAYRKYEDEIKARRKIRDEPDYDPQHDEATRIELGARRVAQATISSWNGRGVQIEGKGDDKRIRVRPGFASWGIPGFDPRYESGEVMPEPSEASEPPGDTSVGVQGVNGSQGEGQTPDWAQALVVVRQQEPAEGPSAGVEESAPIRGIPLVPQRLAEVVQTVEAAEQAQLSDPTEQPPDAGDTALPMAGFSPAVTELLECPACGLAMSNPTVHERWHEDFVKSAAACSHGLLNESLAYSELGAVLEAQLDRFQAGMQGYLTEQFLQVEARFAALRTLLRVSDLDDAWRSSKR